MRNIVAGVMLFIGGLGFGLGVGFSIKKESPITVRPQGSQSVLSNDKSVRTMIRGDQRNPLAVQSEELTAADRDDANDSTWLLFIEENDARIADIEDRIAVIESAAAPEPDSRTRGRSSLEEFSLQQAGFDEIEVAEIADFYNRQQLQRLELRDKAIREGWIESDEYRRALTELRSQSALRSSLGENRFDQLLLAQGRNNRVKIDEVMSGSTAQESGVLPNDVISLYAATKIYTVRELQAATTAGERDELVTLVIVRGGEELQFIVPRGPLGVTVSGVQVDPEN